MSKKKEYVSKSVKEIRREIKTALDNRYFDLWMSKYESDLDPELFHYLFKEFYNKGTVAGFPIEHVNELGVCPYTTQTYNMYDYPETVNLTNLRNSPLIPVGEKIVNKDVVLGWCLSNHKSIKFMVDKYIAQIVNIEMVINTQLTTLNLPFLVAINPEDMDRANDIITKILNNEPVVFMDFQDLSLVKTLANNNPYIIDKLSQHKQEKECELLTYLGLDNAVSQQVNLDITNANNNLINAFRDNIDTNIQNFVKDCKEYLGIEFYLKLRQTQNVQSIYEEGNPQLENNTTKVGVVGGAQQ